MAKHGNKMDTNALNGISGLVMQSGAVMHSATLDDSDKSLLKNIKKDMMGVVSTGNGAQALLAVSHRLGQIKAHLTQVKKAAQAQPSSEQAPWQFRITILSQMHDALAGNAKGLESFAPPQTEAAEDKYTPSDPEKASKDADDKDGDGDSEVDDDK